MKIMVLDGNSLAYRAFFALPTDMATASGQVTNAVFGFASMLSNLLKDHKPDGVVVVFDRPEPTFRHLLVPEYKAQRETAPEILRQQMGVIRELLGALGVKTIDLEGFEGDDIIATLARQCREGNNDIVIVTGDRDSYQLVSDPYVKVLYLKRGVSDYSIYDEAGIKDRTGVTPARYVDYAALRGDPSDNLLGTPGVGEKTAAKLVNTYASLVDIFDHAPAQTPKLRASLEESREWVLRNAGVMILRDDLPIDLAPGEEQPRPDFGAVGRLLDFLEMHTMKKRLMEAFSLWEPAASQGSSSDEENLGEVRISSDYVAVDASNEKTVLQKIAAAEHRGIAAVWSNVKRSEGLEGVAVSVADEAWVFPVVQNLVDTLNSSAGEVVGHDVKPLLRALLERGYDLVHYTFDSAIAAYLLDPVDGGHDLAALVDARLGRSLAESSESDIPDGQLDFGDTPVLSGAKSACIKARASELLSATLVSSLDAEAMLSLYRDIEHPLIRVLARMEALGIGVDRECLRRINDELIKRAGALTAKLIEVVGRPINFNSPTQLQEVLYTERGLTKGKKIKTGFSTDAATLEKLRDEWPEFIDPLLEYREVEKLRGTYGQGLLDAVRQDGRIHATFQQAVARTGRLSSENPNLHNIPIRSEAGKIFRTAFVAREGCELMVADYNQIELRCIAHLANDPGLIQAFTDGIDIHNATAARVFGVDPKQVTTDQRSRAKMVSYGLAYGMEAYGLSQRLSIGVDEASGILNAYFEAFPSVRQYMDDTVGEARRTGGTVTLFGRRRPIPELLSDNFRVRQAGERQAMNAGIQGLAADIFKVALVRIDQALEDQKLESRLVLQVHDEVIVEAPHGEREVVNSLVLDIMRHATELRVPLEVNSAWGATWAEAK